MPKRQNRPEARLVAQLRKHFERLGLFTATELSLGHGRADIVCFQVDPTKCHSRFNNAQFRSLDRIEHYTILRLLPEVTSGQVISINDLSHVLKFSPSHLQNVLLSFLIRFGYATEVQPRRFAKINGFVPVANEIWAIEAKVVDWKKGAIQAKRHQVFANRVYLALSKKYAHRVDRELLTHHRIGLLTVGDEVVEEIPAPNLPPKDFDRFAFAAEWLWRYKRRELKEMKINAS